MLLVDSVLHGLLAGVLRQEKIVRIAEPPKLAALKLASAVD